MREPGPSALARGIPFPSRASCPSPQATAALPLGIQTTELPANLNNISEAFTCRVNTGTGTNADNRADIEGDKYMYVEFFDILPPNAKAHSYTISANHASSLMLQG